MNDDDALSLRPRLLPRIAIAAGVALAIAAIVVFAVVVGGDSGNASPTASERRELADSACPRVSTPHFYRVTKDGKTSYVLGTRHAGVSLAQFPPAVGSALAGAKALVVESLSSAPVARPADPNRSVEEQLGGELWSRYAGLVGDELAARVNHRSIYTATAALVLLYEDTSRELDDELQARAAAAKIPIVPLEVHTAEPGSDHSMEAYAGAASLRRLVTEIPNRSLLRTSVRVQLEKYCIGNTASRLQPSHEYDAVTDRRTRAWIAPLAERLAGGDVFVAVGVAHVEGDVNILRLLRERGYTFEAVR